MALILLLRDVADEVGEVTPPDVVANYLWRRVVGAVDDGIRVALTEPNGEYIDWIVASGKNYEYRAEAVGDNGTSTFGDWVA